MKVRMKTIFASPVQRCDIGEVIDVPQAQAYDLIERGFAEQVEDHVERAVLAGGEETATAPAQRRRHKK
jgi:hypothetical protein